MPTLQQGKYHVTVSGAWMTESQKGTMGIVFKFECEDGDIECTKWVTPGTSEYVIKDLETLGFSRSKLDDIQNLERIEEIIKGHEAYITVEDEEYNGDWKPKVKWINPTGARRVTKADLTANVQAVLLGRSAGLVSAPRGPVHQQQASDGPAPFAPVDEDVPF